MDTWSIVADLPQPWPEIVKILREEYRPVAALLYGSRLPGWPETPLEESDCDIILVVGDDDKKRSYHGHLPDLEDGPVVDLSVVRSKGIRSSQLLSPIWQIQDRYGLKLGDWSWYDPAVPLSWLGADNEVEWIETDEEIAIMGVENADWDLTCEHAVKVARKSLLLQVAIGAMWDYPTWDKVAELYELPAELVQVVRTGAAWPEDEKLLRAWAAAALMAATHALKHVRRAVAAYSRNSSDTEITKKMAKRMENIALAQS